MTTICSTGFVVDPIVWAELLIQLFKPAVRIIFLDGQMNIRHRYSPAEMLKWFTDADYYNTLHEEHPAKLIFIAFKDCFLRRRALAGHSEVHGMGRNDAKSEYTRRLGQRSESNEEIHNLFEDWEPMRRKQWLQDDDGE